MLPVLPPSLFPPPHEKLTGHLPPIPACNPEPVGPERSQGLSENYPLPPAAPLFATVPFPCPDGKKTYLPLYRPEAPGGWRSTTPRSYVPVAYRPKTLFRNAADTVPANPGPKGAFLTEGHCKLRSNHFPANPSPLFPSVVLPDKTLREGSQGIRFYLVRS